MIQRQNSKAQTPSASRRSRLFGSGESVDSSAAGKTNAPAQTASTASRPAVSRSEATAIPTIGATMTVTGDLAGTEDVMVRGKLKGSITLEENDIVVDETGELEGSFIARHVTVWGKVNGDIRGLEKVTVAATGRIEGTISAPRVVLEDGGKFKGMIDMPVVEPAAAEAAGTSREPSPSTPKRVEPAKTVTKS